MGNCVAGVRGVCGGGPKHEARVGEVTETNRDTEAIPPGGGNIW